jgi:hypothetical protein
MASATMKKACAKCSKGGGTAICYGCEQSFCTKHFIEHRQELSQQIDNIGQEHDVLRRALTNEQSIHPLLVRIDQWEQESIAKIQVAAETARADLRQLLNRDKDQLQLNVSKMAEELQSCRESDDYTEIDINKWMEQLKEIRGMLDDPSIVNIEYADNTQSAIRLLKVSSRQTTHLSHQATHVYENTDGDSQKVVSPFRETFGEYCGKTTLSEDGLTATCLDILCDCSCSGIGRYSSGTHHIRIRIEKTKRSDVFFGIVTTSEKMTGHTWLSPSAHGWWDLQCNIVCGKEQGKDANRMFRTGDEVTLILDCNNRQVQLKHHRIDTTVHMPVDIRQCPFPWKIVAVLFSENDCVTIVH